MRREVSVSVFAVLIVAAAVLTVYYLNVGPTGFVVSNTVAGQSTVFSLNASSVLNETLEPNGQYIFSTNNSGTWINDSAVNFTETPSWANVTKPLNSTVGMAIGYQWYLTDNEGNQTNTEVFVLVTTEESAPSVSVSVSQPNTEYISLTGIPLVFTITQTTGTNLNCLYNINYAGGTLVSNTSVSCANGTNTQTFTLTSKGGDNTLTVYVSDSSGSASASSGFSVSVPSGTPPGTGGVVITPTNETPQTQEVQVLVGEVPSQEMDLGTSRQLSISVQNTRTLPATSCILGGDDSGWVTFTDTAKDVNPGESVTLSFSVNVPSDATPGEHTLNLAVDCAETQVPRQLTVNVLEKKLDLDITNVERTRENRVTVDYLLIELAGEAQDVEVLFTITDAAGLAIASTSQNSSIDANETDDFRVNIPINESLEGNLTLLAAFNSQVYSSSVLEPITLGAVTGGAIFGGVGTGGFLIVLIVAVVLVAVFFAARKMRQSGKTLKDLFSH